VNQAAGAGFLADPCGAILAIAGRAEPDLAPAAIAEAISQAAPAREQQRRLARALQDDPALLTSGRPAGPPQVERLILALLAVGARNVTQQRCGHCELPRPLPALDGRTRICAACDDRRRVQAEPCSRCGSQRRYARVDRNGSPVCRRCQPYHDGDPAGQISSIVSGIEPGLDRQTLAELINAAVPRQFQRHQVLWELQANPGLLTGGGAHGSPRVNALIQALLTAGAQHVIAPACPSCGRTVALTCRRDSMRCCRRCYDEAACTPCSRCRRPRPVSARTAEGHPVCSACFQADPANHERCAGCGRITLVYRHEGRPYCHRCFRAPVASCSICGKDKPCYFAGTSRQRCESCTRQMRRLPCSRCGKTLAVWSRTPDGQPLCSTCCKRPESCRTCGRARPVRGRTPEGPLCKTCYSKDPASFRPCSNCGVTERLHHHGLCQRCACHQQLLALLSLPNGEMHAHIQPVFRLLADGKPSAVLQWLDKSAARAFLAEASQSAQPITHQMLDRLSPSQSADYLRRALVAGQILPPRDEYLRLFERWIGEAVTAAGDPDERRIIRRFAVWQPLRHLRDRAERGSLTRGQYDRARATVRAAIALTSWLRANGTTLAACSQRDLDRWLADAPSTHYNARPFVSWACRAGHAHDVAIPPPADRRPAARIEDDERWAMVRRLLHDESVLPGDRVAGLLLLLFGQPLSRIARLRRDQVVTGPDGATQIVIGTHPLVVPPPLDELLLHFAAGVPGHAVLTGPGEHPWLFPGGAPGLPLTATQLMRRLQKLGIRARPARNTVMLDLASQMPAVILSKLLAINVKTATRWTATAEASHAAYASVIARRGAQRNRSPS
jgi:hypothetical protein